MNLPVTPVVHGPACVLVVSADAFVTRIVRWWLEQLGHQANLAESLAQARSLIARAVFDVVLVDAGVGANDRDEDDFCAECRAIEHTPLLAITASLQDRAEWRPFDLWLVRPLSRSKIMEAIDSVRSRNEPSAREQRVARGEVLDIERFREVAGDERELIVELRNLFLSAYPTLLQNLATAIASRDPALIKKAAHGARGVYATYSTSIAEDLRAMETASDPGDLAAIDKSYGSVLEKTEQLVSEMKAYGEVV